jgi:alpha-methylacyl-CoA racemase
MRPLEGLRVVELATIGPAPFCGMVLADLGADVLRVERPGEPRDVWESSPVLDRGRRVVAIDLKDPQGVRHLIDEIATADVLIEGFRPGVTERLGVGPADALAANPRLVYGRMTGWGQSGPYAHTAGHDITYLATSGALHAIGAAGGRPIPPVNLLGDFGGGGMLLAVGVLAAVLQAQRTGRGQVVDAAIVDGAALLTGMLHGLLAIGAWTDDRGVNLLDGGAPFYDTYRCADGRFVAVGALEARFFRTLLRHLGLAEHPAFAGDHLDRTSWPIMRRVLAATFASRARDDWGALLRDTDCCVAPVLSLSEATKDPHNVARKTFQQVNGVTHSQAAPRFIDPEALRN